MPLLDHFHEPLLSEDSWESFHSFWAVSIGEYLNNLLPSRYRAFVQIHLGSQVEADVAEFERNGDDGLTDNDGGVSLALKTYTPPAVTLRMRIAFPDDVEVRVFDTHGTRQLVAVVELVSPGNKDRPQARGVFAGKSAAYLARGVGLVTVDTVTSHHFHLHNELVRLMQLDPAPALSEEDFLSAVAYRPTHRNDASEVDVWAFPLAVGQPLPLTPLPLRGGAVVPLDLDFTYAEARRRSRL